MDASRRSRLALFTTLAERYVAAAQARTEHATPAFSAGFIMFRTFQVPTRDVGAPT